MFLCKQKENNNNIKALRNHSDNDKMLFFKIKQKNKMV